MSRTWLWLLVVGGGLFLGGVILSVISGYVLTPAQDREWELGQERLPSATLRGDELTIDNVRNFSWRKEGEQELADGRYETRTYHLNNIQGVDVFISHFSSFEGLAHLFFSFTFADSEPLVLSVESRREDGETFSPLLGMYSQYEIILVAGTERDLVGVRTHVRDERVYRYPTTLQPDEAKQLLQRLIVQMQQLVQTPQFYNTLNNNCTNVVTREMEEVLPVRFPGAWRILLPGYFDGVLREMNLLLPATNGTQDREAYRVRDDLDPTDPTFSAQLRQP